MRLAITVMGLVACLAVSGCQRGGSDAQKKGAKEAVNLPPRPDLAVKPVAEKFQDGAWSIDGLLKNVRDLNGKEATVRGYIEKVEPCKDPCTTDPHLVLVDDLKAPRKRLTVVLPAGVDPAGFEAKSGQTLTGTVGMSSPSGRLINLDGILVLKAPEPPKTEGADAKGAPSTAKK